MCDTCRSLTEKIDRAARAGETEKARVLRVLFLNHVRQCPETRGAVIVQPERVYFPSGMTWTVSEGEA